MSHTLQISSDPSGATLTPAQKRFNTLIPQIEQARQTLVAWDENTAAYRQAHAQVLLPLREQVIEGCRQWVFALDVLLNQKGWTKAERATLRDVLCDAAGALLAACDDDTAIKAVFDKHADVDFDTEQREMLLAMKGLTEAMTGLDLGDEQGLETEADLFARMQQGVHERAAAEEAARSAKAARRGKSAAQQRREAQAQQATQSVREVYRKLASALHPDRETDPRQREEKTALMQRVNQAYDANDLLGLLELQLQIEQIDASHVAHASADRLKHYNTVLAEQLAELKEEIRQVELAFRAEFGYAPGVGIKPGKLGELLEQTDRQCRIELSAQQRELRMLDDVAATKRWLKRPKRRLREEEEFDFELF